MDIYVPRICIAQRPYIDIPAWILMRIYTLAWIIEDWHEKIMDIPVDNRGFWKSMYGYAMGSRTRADLIMSSTV